MAIVTYLLGAGASSQALPMYTNFGERFKAFKKIFNGLGNQLRAEDLNILNQIIESINIIELEFAFHNTPDTIAKKYFHLGKRGQTRLKELKKILILFFLYEQSLSALFIDSSTLKDKGKSPVDRRYDSFIASVLEPEYNLIKVQPNINVLTWNYDLQFEICFQNYLQKDLAQTQINIQSVPNIINTGVPEDFDSRKFSIIHLNGIAYPQILTSTNLLQGSLHENVNSLANELIKIYSYMSELDTDDEDFQLLNFAWERHVKYPSKKELLEFTLTKAIEIARQTDILVVIGYSFPIFNRTIDVSIFKEMQNLTKTYVQAPNAEGLIETMLSAFKEVNPNIISEYIEPIRQVDYFYLPLELTK